MVQMQASISIVLVQRQFQKTFSSFLGRYGHKKPKYNTKRLQGTFSTVCGSYCIYFLMMRCRGISFEDILSQFSFNDYYRNDSMVSLFMNKHFNLNIPMIDKSFFKTLVE